MITDKFCWSNWIPFCYFYCPMITCEKIVFFVLLLFCRQALFSQYILNGSAQKNSCNCYTLTQAVQTQSGSVWNGTKINLNTSFDFWFNVYLGCNDATGADGIVFMLQPISTSVGATGEGMGFSGVSPSIGITLDTWQNNALNDPSYDHISIQANGVVAHGSDLAGPVPISATGNNVEDCGWHTLRIRWDAGTKWLRTYFDSALRLEKQIDLVAAIFNNDPNVYWGFSGATGGSVNLQQFCTALNPKFTTNLTADGGCEGLPVTFTNASESFASITSYSWSFGDGTFSNAASPPPHLYSAAGSYRVNLKIKGQDGCESDSTKTITIGAIPSADLRVFDVCAGQRPEVNFVAPASGTSYQWTLDGSAADSMQPLLYSLAEGSHQLGVTVTSLYGCGPPAVAIADFLVKPVPVIDAQVQDGCAGQILFFDGSQFDTTSIRQWNWRIGAGRILQGQNIQTVFADSGLYTVAFWAVGVNGCSSDTVSKPVRIVKAFVIANDTTVMRNVPSQLTVQSSGNVSWSPATGLSNPFVSNPVVRLAADQRYSLTAVTPEGCTAEDTMRVKVFTGPTVYVPSAFTPNGDGKNDILLPVYVGMQELKRFAVFNRWGQTVFSTKDTGKGWEGRNAVGTHVWLVEAVDYLGQPVVLKGTVTIIR